MLFLLSKLHSCPISRSLSLCVYNVSYYTISNRVACNKSNWNIFCCLHTLKYAYTLHSVHWAAVLVESTWLGLASYKHQNIVCLVGICVIIASFHAFSLSISALFLFSFHLEIAKSQSYTHFYLWIYWCCQDNRERKKPHSAVSLSKVETTHSNWREELYPSKHI